MEECTPLIRVLLHSSHGKRRLGEKSKRQSFSFMIGYTVITIFAAKHANMSLP